MTDQPAFEVTSDDKLWVLLAYIFSPFIPVVLMLMEDKKNRPFIKAHNAQALVLGVIELVMVITAVLACFQPIVWIVMIYWGIQAYNGKLVTIPVVTDFCKNQGWA
jgi:uncharacterized protein